MEPRLCEEEEEEEKGDFFFYNRLYAIRLPVPDGTP